MTALGPHDRPWGSRPYTSITVVHAMFWYIAMVWSSWFGWDAVFWTFVFEASGLWMYRRWLLGWAPYEEGASSDTQRCAW